MVKLQKQAIKIPEGALKSWLGTILPSPPPLPAPSLCFLPLSPNTLSPSPISVYCRYKASHSLARWLLLLQTAVGLTDNGLPRDKRHLIRLESYRERKMERERGRQRERVALGVPLWLDSHLVAMCDRSSGANDGLPEASSIRPGLTGLPEREAEREMTIDMPVPYFVRVCVYESICTVYSCLLLGCVRLCPMLTQMCVFRHMCACTSPPARLLRTLPFILWSKWHLPSAHIHVRPPPEWAKTN